MAINFTLSKTPPKSRAEPDASVDDYDFGLQANWEERVVTAVATSVALMIVAAVALLMGMV